MTKEQIDAIKRKEAREIVEGPMPHGIVLAVEEALSLEWWRGYHAAAREFNKAFD
jgi:hypothetical protein